MEVSRNDNFEAAHSVFVTGLELDDLETAQFNLRVSTPQSHFSSRDEPVINHTEDGCAIYQEGNRIPLDFSTIDMKIRAGVKRSTFKDISSYNRNIRPARVTRIYIGRVSWFIR